MPQDDIGRRALEAARSERRIGSRFHPSLLEIDQQGTATVEAEVESIAVKRLVLERIAATPGVSGIVDRLRVRPASAMSDAGIRDHLRKAYGQESSFQALRITERVMGEDRRVRDAPDELLGEIVLDVEEGVVTLNGTVPSLVSKRLAGVLAWWIPGSRDVINGLEVDPPEDDAPIQIEEAVRIALDKDPFVEGSQIRVGVRDRTVHLTGAVRSEAVREMAERDAWYVFGVDDVRNGLDVHPPPS